MGCNGRNLDSGFWRDCALKQNIETGCLKIPPPKPLHCTEGEDVPYHMISDEAFPLKSYMMKPYSRSDRMLTHDKMIFNYRLSRARRIIGKYNRNNKIYVAHT